MMRQAVVALASVAVFAGCLPPARIARMRDTLAEEARRGRVDQALREEHRILELASGYYGSATLDLAKLRGELAENYARWGWSDRASSLATENLAEMERVHGPESEALVSPLLSLARVRILLRAWSEAERALDRVLEICGPGNPGSGSSTREAGDCRILGNLHLQNLYAEAGNPEKSAEASLLADSREAEFWTRRSALLELGALGRTYAEFGDYPKALWYLRVCVENARDQYPLSEYADEHDPSRSAEVEIEILDSAHSFPSRAPRCLEDLVSLHQRLGEDGDAERLAAWERQLWDRGPEAAAALAERIRDAEAAGRDEYERSFLTNTLGFCFARMNRPSDAARAFAGAIELLDRGFARVGDFGAPYPAALLVDELLGLGAAQERLARHGEAREAYARAADAAARRLHPRHLWRLEALAGVARTTAAAGRPGDAVIDWDRYLEVAVDVRGPDHADYARGLMGLADALAGEGRLRESARARTRAQSMRAAYRRKLDAVHDLPLPASLLSFSPRAN